MNAKAPTLEMEQQQSKRRSLGNFWPIGRGVNHDRLQHSVFLDEQIQLIQARLEEDLSEDVQTELAIMLNLVYRLHRHGCLDIYHRRHLILALQSLLSPTPKLSFVRCLRYELEAYLRVHGPSFCRFIVRFSGVSAVNTMLAGLLATIVFSPFLYALLLYAFYQHQDLFGEFLTDATALKASVIELTVLTGAAFLGSIVSMLVRIDCFASLRFYDPTLVFLKTYFRPFIAVVFSLFLYALLKSQIIVLAGLELNDFATDIKAIYLLGIMGFLCGFSERFARDIIKRTEERVTWLHSGNQGKAPEQVVKIS